MIKALVVEDDPLYLKTICDFLKDQDCEYKACSNGLEAQKVLENNPGFNLVITDIIMPEADGLELSRYIRESYPANDIYIIGISSGTHTILKEEALNFAEMYANATLAKPFKKEELLEQLQIAKAKFIKQSSGP